MAEYTYANMAQWTQAWLRAHPKRRALSQKTRYRLLPLSYAEIDAYVQKCRRLFAEQGCRQGDRVILIGPNGPSWATALLACIQSGLVAVPLDMHSSPELIEAVAKQTKPVLMLTYGPTLAGVKCLRLDDLMRRLESMPESALPLADIGENNLFEIVYTSGTTGFPKGVMLTHGNMVAGMKNLLSAVRLPLPLNFLSTLPLSHMLEQISGLFFPLSQGCAVVYPDALWPSRLARVIREQKIHACVTVPGLLRTLKESLQRSGQNPRRALGWRFRLAGVGGSALDPELEKWWSNNGVRVIQGYGMTEAGPMIASNTILRKRPGCLGRPASGVEVRLSQEGEIQARGKNVTVGYWELPEKTAALFTQDGWLKTGDIGQWQDGWLYFRGRLKDMIASDSGVKVFPEDIEPKINAVAGVKDSCVLEHRGKVWAVLLLEKPVPTQKVLETINAGLMAHQKIAGATVWPQPDFPRTPLGKIRRFEVIQTLGQMEENSGAAKPVVYAGKLEEIIGRISKRAQIRSEDKLVNLGMDSLDRMILLSAIEEEMGAYVDERQISETTTVAQLSALAAKSQTPPTPPSGLPWQFSWPAELVRLAVGWLPLAAVNAITRPSCEGLEHLEGLKAPVIFAVNHQSAWDNVIVHRFLPQAFKKCVAPAWTDFYGYYTEPAGPFKRLILRGMGFSISLFYRGYPFGPAAGTEHSFETSGRLVDQGFSIMIFPEGSRTPDGKIHNFMPGIGELSKEMRLPIVPVRIEGMHDILPYPRYVIPKKIGRTRVIFGAPIHLDAHGPPTQAAKAVRQAIEALA